MVKEYRTLKGYELDEDAIDQGAFVLGV